MQLIPPLKALAMSAADPGDLVRTRIGGEWLPGLISTVAPDKAAGVIIILEPQPGFTDLRYRPFPTNSSPLVLSFGKNYAFRSPRSARTVVAISGEFEHNGAMLVGETDTLVRVFPAGSSDPVLFYNVANGICSLSSGDSRNRLALLDWDIQLSDAKKDDPPIFRFAAP
jgi:hypothetical protein